MTTTTHRMTFQAVAAALTHDGETVDAIYRRITGFDKSLTKRQRRARLAVAEILETMLANNMVDTYTDPEHPQRRLYRRLD